MNTKTIAIAAVVIIVVIAAVAAVVVLNDDDDDNSKPITTGWGEGTVMAILGNVNGDEVLDSSDVDGIQKLIDDGASVSEYPWADANQDGKIDSGDIAVVQKLINHETTPVNVLCVDRNGDRTVVEVTYPLRDVVTYTGNINADVLLCGGQQYVAGYNNCSYKNLEADLIAVDGITDLGGSSMTFAFNKFIQLDGEVQAKNGTGVGALIGDASRRSNLSEYYDQFETAGIPLLMLNTITMSDQISAVVTLGYLFSSDCYAQALAFKNVCQPIADQIESAVSSLSDDSKKTVIGIIMGYRLMASSSEYYTTMREAGAIPYYDVDSTYASAIAGTSTVPLSTTENILVNYDDKVDYILSARSVDAKSTNLGKTITDTWDRYKTYFENLDCYHNFFYVNALLPAVVKVAYIVENIYPDLLGTGYADSVFDKVVSVSPYYMSGCTVKNTFTDVTYSDYEGILNGTITFDDPDTPVTPDVPVQTDASAKAIADAFVAANPTTPYTHDAKTIAEAIVANADSSIGTWAVVDGATEDSATISFTYIGTNGSPATRNVTIQRSADAASTYSSVASTIGVDDNYTLLDTSSITDVKVTAATRILPVGSLVVKFAIQYGSIVTENTNGGLINFGKEGTTDQALAVVKSFADAIKDGASYATWTVADGATAASATLNDAYTNNSGSSSTRSFQITTGVSSTSYDTAAAALTSASGSYTLLSPTLSNEHVQVTAFGRTMSSAYLLKFVMYYNGAMITVSEDSIYINNGQSIEALTLINDFATAIVAGGGTYNGGSDTPSTSSSASAVASSFVEKNPITVFTKDAKTIVDAFVAANKTVEWTAVDGATADSASFSETYTSRGSSTTKTIPVVRTATAASDYITIAAAIAETSGYSLIDTSSISDVNVTAYGRTMGSAYLMKFVMQYGSVLIDANEQNVRIGDASDSTGALAILVDLASAVKADASTATWSVANGAASASATIVETYTTSRGQSTKDVSVSTGKTSADYQTAATAVTADSAYTPLNLSLSDSSISVTAATRAMGSNLMVRFAMLYNDVLIDVSSTYVYVLGGAEADALAVINAFAEAIKATGGSDTPATPDTPTTSSSASAVASSFVEKNPTTVFTKDAKTIVDAFVATDKTVEWTAVDGATADSASFSETYTNSRGENTKTITVVRSATAASDYATIAEAVRGHSSYAAIDTSSITDVNVTAMGITMGGYLVRFVMQYGSILVDGNTNDYARLASESDALTFLTNLANAVKADASTSTWSVVDGATASSATINENYTSSRGQSSQPFTVSTGKTTSDYQTAAAAATSASSYSVMDVTLSIDGVSVTAASRTMGSNLMVKFAMLYNDVLIDGTSGYLYILGGSQVDAAAILNAFAAAITATA